MLAGSGGYPLYLNGATHWRISGFTIRGGQKGLVADHATANLIEGLRIEQVGQEGLHLRAASTDNVVRSNQIRFTGRTTAQFGEGVYIGSAVRSWPEFGGGPDRSDGNVVEANTISDTTAECVDTEEGSTDGLLRNNSFSGRALAGGYADSWVDVKVNGWTIAGNVGAGTPADGNQVHRIVPGWGVGNRFDANTSVLGRGTGYAIDITANPTRNTVGCGGRVSGGRGLTNVHCVAKAV